VTTAYDRHIDKRFISSSASAVLMLLGLQSFCYYPNEVHVYRALKGKHLLHFCNLI